MWDSIGYILGLVFLTTVYILQSNATYKKQLDTIKEISNRTRFIETNYILTLYKLKSMLSIIGIINLEVKDVKTLENTLDYCIDKIDKEELDKIFFKNSASLISKIEKYEAFLKGLQKNAEDNKEHATADAIKEILKNYE